MFKKLVKGMNCKRSMLLLSVFLVALMTMVGPARAGDGFRIDSVVVTDVSGNEKDEFDVYEPVMIYVHFTFDQVIVPCLAKVIVKAFDQRHRTKQIVNSAGSYTIIDSLISLSSGEKTIKCILKVFNGDVLLGREKVVKNVTIIGVHGPECWGLEESDCRSCHGNNLANRHHLTPIVLRDRLCTVCHPTCTIGTADCPNGIRLIRDCLASGCHTPID